MGTQYLLIYFGEDGPTFQRMGKEKLTKLLNEDPDMKNFVDYTAFGLNEAVHAMSGEVPCYSYLIIKDPMNNIVLPKAKVSVTEWRVD